MLLRMSSYPPAARGMAGLFLPGPAPLIRSCAVRRLLSVLTRPGASYPFLRAPRAVCPGPAGASYLPWRALSLSSILFT